MPHLKDRSRRAEDLLLDVPKLVYELFTDKAPLEGGDIVHRGGETAFKTISRAITSLANR